jgi:ferredoxin
LARICGIRRRIMKAIVDEDTCTGCGLCEETCPEVFRLGDDDVADVIVGEIPPEAEDAAREAAEGCPVEAIKIEE